MTSNSPRLAHRAASCYNSNVSFLLRCALIGAAASAISCGANAMLTDGPIGSQDAADSAASDSSVPRDGNSSAIPCSADASAAQATGQIRVGVQVDSTLDVMRNAVWVAAMCLDGPVSELSVRVISLDATGMDALVGGLLPGRYAVRTSSLVVPSVRSNDVAVTQRSLAVTQLALTPGPRLLGSARAVIHASRIEAPVIDPRVGRDPVGRVVAEFLPRDATSFDVRVQVQMACATCSIVLDPATAEIRVTRAGQPFGFAAGAFPRATLASGTSASLTQTLTVPGRLDDAATDVMLLFFGNTLPMR